MISPSTTTSSFSRQGRPRPARRKGASGGLGGYTGSTIFEKPCSTRQYAPFPTKPRWGVAKAQTSYTKTPTTDARIASLTGRPLKTDPEAMARQQASTPYFLAAGAVVVTAGVAAEVPATAGILARWGASIGAALDKAKGWLQNLGTSAPAASSSSGGTQTPNLPPDCLNSLLVMVRRAFRNP